EKTLPEKTLSRQTMSREEQQQAQEMAARDREVKAHEAAHKAAGGGLTGPASYTYATGPDGKRYATGGEVSVDTSAVPGDPQATLIKANRIQAAALAPAQPSGQDRKVAAQAAQMAAEARADMIQRKRQDNEGEPADKQSLQLSRQPLYDNSGTVSHASGAGNVLDEMV
ncbi:MAG: catalase, partial [Gammaproteobacteria bacterium]|nr:catalase [Gammaproteobacteria bacterium]